MTWKIVGANGAVQKAASDAASKGASALDSATWGAASAALAEGQGMWAWGQMAQAQNYPNVTVSKGPQYTWMCPAGYKYEGGSQYNPNHSQGYCIAPNGIRLSPFPAEECNQSTAPNEYGNYEHGAWMCDPLVLYMQANHPNLFAAKNQYLVAVQPMLNALRVLGAFVEGQWPSIQVSVQSLAYALSTKTWESSDEDAFPTIYTVLIKAAQPAYEAEKVPPKKLSSKTWAVMKGLSQKKNDLAQGNLALGEVSPLPLFLGMAGVGALAYFYPARASALYRSGLGLAGKTWSSVRSLWR